MEKTPEQLEADKDAVEKAHGAPREGTEYSLTHDGVVRISYRPKPADCLGVVLPPNFTDWAAFEKEVREPATEPQIRNRVYLESRVKELSTDLIRANAAKGRWVAVTILLAAACILETWYILGLPPK